MNSYASVIGLALLLVRPGMLVMGTPFFGALNAPMHIRVGFTVLLALVMSSVVVLPSPLPVAGLTVVIAREMGIGFAMALAIRALLAGAEFAGHFSGYQIGLSLGALIDPQSGVRNNVLALLYGNLAVIICLSTNAHHALLHALADSYAALPVGLGGVADGLSTSVARLLGLVFVLGTRMAAPVVIVLLLVELAMGLLSRVAPSLNVMSSGAPIRSLVGLVVIAAGISALPGLIGRYVPSVMELGATLARAFR